MGKYDQAIELNQQALVLEQEIGDRTGEGVTTGNLGQIAQKQGQYQKALGLYEQALAIHREVGDKISEAATLKFLGDVLSAQNQPQLAIAFYKQSVNLTETIRQSLRSVPADIQQSYTETVAERYRRLADLLLKQNRPAEAQQVLDLLKLQEVHDYLGNRPIQPETAKTLPLKPQEEKITEKYSTIEDKAIALGKELANLRQISPKLRTSTHNQRIAELVKLEQQNTAEFNQFIKSPPVENLV